MLTLYWDFYGPRAAGTAQHFQVHLRTFLQQNALQGCPTGVASPTPVHHAAWCTVPEEQAAAVQAALRPQRAEPGPMGVV